MICLDTNILIYAHRSSCPQHARAVSALEEAVRSDSGCGISLPSIAEFWSVVTHVAAARRPSTPEEASGFIDSLVRGAGVRILMPGPGHWKRLVQTARDLDKHGNGVFDLQIALVALDNGAREMWTHDSEFIRLPGLKVVDPLAG